MITLAQDCLLFEMSGGESIPFSAEMVTVEIVGAQGSAWDEDFVRQAAKAVFHYFKQEMGRQTVTVGEFTSALEKVLHGLNLRNGLLLGPEPAAEPAGGDLGQLARESGFSGELSFFPRLREELRRQVRCGLRVVRFQGLRECVKHLVGTGRWTGQCRSLEEQIVEYLRGCLSAETSTPDRAMLVE